MAILKIKQGETFSITGAYLEDDGITPKPLTGVALTSQVRSNRMALVATLDFTLIGEAAGIYHLSAPDGTANWPVGTLSWDIRESINGVVKLTVTHFIKVEAAVTKL